MRFNKLIFRLPVVGGLTLLFSACLHGDQEAAAEDSLASLREFLAQQEETQQSVASAVGPEQEPEASYVVNRGDTIQVTVYRHSELSTLQRVDGNGRIRMSLIGTVDVAGKSIRSGEAYIEERYRDGRILRNPEVTITVAEYAPRFASVLGNVESPGRIQFPVEEERIDIVDLITKAGGFTRIARPDRVRLTRVSENGDEETITVNVQDMMEGRERENRSRVYVYPGNTIFVPERFF